IQAWIMAGVTIVVFISYSHLWSGGMTWLFHDLAVTAFVLLVMVMAELTRIVRERRAQQQQAAEEETRRQASEERLTMAQELQDVLAQKLSLIHMHASTALHFNDDKPEHPRTALATIKTASTEMLGEMHSMMIVLRDGSSYSPTAALDRIHE